MKLNLKAFSDLFVTVSAGVPGRTSKDILRNILIVHDGKMLTLSSSDGEMHLRAEMECEGEAIRLLLPSARIIAILRELSGEFLTIEKKKDGIQLKCGQADYRLGMVEESDFPKVPSFDTQDYFSFEPGPLKEAIKKTIFCTDTTSTRYALGGVNILITVADKDYQAMFAATDSRRLSEVSIGCKRINLAKWPESPSPVIPEKALKILLNSIEDQSCFVAVNANTISFKVGNLSVSSQLIQGRFPDVRKVIPAKDETRQYIGVIAGPFKTLINQVRVMETEEANRVTLEFKNGMLTASTGSNEIGDAKAEIPLSYDGATMKVSLGGRFVAEYLKILEPTTTIDVYLSKTNPGDDRVLFSIPEFDHVIMPLAVD